MKMMSVNERLARVRLSYGRLFTLLDGPDRGPLVMAEITHVAAHLAEHTQALDKQLAAVNDEHDPRECEENTVFALRELHRLRTLLKRQHHDRAEETAPSA